jgi:hypothetical protein
VQAVKSCRTATESGLPRAHDALRIVAHVKYKYALAQHVLLMAYENGPPNREYVRRKPGWKRLRRRLNIEQANFGSGSLHNQEEIAMMRVVFPFAALSLAVAASVSFPAAAQSSQGIHRGQPEKEIKFEVLSIKPVKRGPVLKAWQSQGKNRDLLRSALRIALTERFKLALHEEPAQRPMFELVVAKRGPRLMPADPGAILPVGAKLPSGGVDTGIGPRRIGGWDLHGATMQDLAYLLNFLSNQFDGPVQDRTGLTGRYDFQVQRVETPDENQGYTYSVSHLGLELKRGTENRPILVIDHVERPTPN